MGASYFQTSSQEQETRKLEDVRSDIEEKKRKMSGISSSHCGYIGRLTASLALSVFMMENAELTKLKEEYLDLGGKPEDIG